MEHPDCPPGQRWAEALLHPPQLDRERGRRRDGRREAPTSPEPAPLFAMPSSPRGAPPPRSTPAPSVTPPKIRHAPPCWREPAALRPHEARQGPPIRRPAPCPTASQALPPRPPPPSSPNEAPACRAVLLPIPPRPASPLQAPPQLRPRPCNPRPAPASHTRQPSPSAGPRRTVPNAIASAVPCQPEHGTRIISATYKNTDPGGGSGAGRRPEKTTFAGRTACPGVPVHR